MLLSTSSLSVFVHFLNLRFAVAAMHLPKPLMREGFDPCFVANITFFTPSLCCSCTEETVEDSVWECMGIRSVSFSMIG